jgi:hypothetical protein
MPETTPALIAPADRAILREVALRIAEVAALPVMEERRRSWKAHNELKPGRPRILIFPEGAWSELLTGDQLRCEGEAARSFEWQLRARLYAFDHFADDTVVEGDWTVGKAIWNTGWGLESQWHPSGQEKGARGFDPIVKSPADLKRLQYPEVVYDAEETDRRVAQAHDLFDGILQVKLKGISHVSFHLPSFYTSIRGLSEVMEDMTERPEMLHEALRFLEEGNRRIIQQYIDGNLFSLNNDGAYHSSGGVGYTDELPAPGFDPEHVRPRDIWASAESQEYAQVSPRMHVEFALQYERRLLEPFGLLGYGCCEDLTLKLDDVCAVPHMRRLSISPWADVDKCAARLRGDFIFSWKPQPAHLVGRFDEDALRAYIQHTVDAARAHGCVLEMILKDTHTCENHAERFDRWTKIAREVVEG